MLVEVAHEYHPSPASRRSLPGPQGVDRRSSGPGFFVAPGPASGVSLCRLVRGGGLPEKFQDLLQAVLRDDLEVEPRYYITSVRTFEEAGVPSGDRGLVVTMSDGTEYQITIVRSR